MFKRLPVIVVEFVTMAMALVNQVFAVDFMGARAGDHLTRVIPQPDSPPILLLGDMFHLARHQVDDGVRGIGIGLGRTGFFQPTDISGKFDDTDLHSVTQAEIGDLFDPREVSGLDFALNPRLPPRLRNDDAVILPENGRVGQDFFG